MPQLQNNNRAPVKNNSGNAPRNGSYINEVKVADDYRTPSNASIILNGIGNITNNIVANMQEFTTKAQQLESENKFNEYKIELDNKTKEYKFNYQKNPSEELTKEYEEDIQALKDNYEKQIPALYKNNFLQRADLMNKSQNMDFFRKIADLQYQSNKYTETLNNSLNIVHNASYEGNFDAMSNEVTNLSLRKQQIMNLYGESEGSRIYNDYTRELIKSFIGGRIASNNPDDVLDVVKIIEMSPEFKDKLRAEEIEHYRKRAKEKRDELEKAKKTREVTEYAVKTSKIVNDIANQRLNNYEDLVNTLIETGTDEYESRLIMKIAGYSSELPPELLDRNRNTIKTGNKAIDKELNRKKSTFEKEQYEANIQEKIFSLYEGIDDEDSKKALEVEYNRDMIANRIKQIQTELLEGMAGGYITGSEYSKYANQLTPYMAQVLDATAKGNFDDGKWYTWNIGYKDLNNKINEILELNGLDTDANRLKGIESDKYYFIKNNITNNFNNSMERQFNEFKNSDIGGKYKDVNNWIEFQKHVSRDVRKNMYNRAIKEAVVKYAKDQNINVTPFIDRNTNEINYNLLKTSIKQESDRELQNLMYTLVN